MTIQSDKKTSDTILKYSNWLNAGFSGLFAGLSAPGVTGLGEAMWFAWIFGLLCIRLLQIRLVNKKWQTGWLELLKTGFQVGFIAGFIYGGIYCQWCFDLHPMAWMGFSEWESRAVTFATWLLLSAEHGLMLGCLFAFYAVLRARWQRVFLFPVAWVLGFSLLNATPLALPWALPEYTQASVPGMLWVSSVIGGGGVSALIAFVNTIQVELLSVIRPLPKSGVAPFRPEVVSGKKVFLPFLKLLRFTLLDWRIWLYLSVSLFIVGHRIWYVITLEKGANPLDNRSTSFSVAVVQANLPIDVIRSGSLSPELVEASYIRPVTDSTLPAHTLLVYPEEGVVPGWVSRQHPHLNAGFRRLVRLAQEKNIFIVSGLSLSDEQSGQRYNAVALISPKPDRAPQFYLKRRLVPFGEFTPYGLGDWLKTTLAGVGVDYSTGFSAGEANPVPLQMDSIRIAPLICFELIDAMPWDALWYTASYNGFTRKYRQAGATILINSSNLGWFHQNYLLEQQFLAIAQIRAAESHLPLVISANTGPSAILDSNGKIRGRLDQASFFQHKSRILLYNGKL